MSASTSGADVGKSSTAASKPGTRKLRHSNPALPTPFTPAPENVQTFVNSLDKRHVYITHIDLHPGWFKRRVFLVPVTLNLFIALVLAWRLYVVLPWYTEIVRALFERPGDFGTTLSAKGDWKIIAWTILKRAFTFLLDYVLVTIVAPWPYSFFMERPGNPMKWRTSVRFLAQEVCVRTSRGWGAGELMGGTKKGEESPYWRVRVVPAISRENWFKTGYMLMGRDFDLDFAAMITAHKLIDDRENQELKLRDLDRKVWVYYPPITPAIVSGEAEDHGQWVVASVGDKSETEAIETSAVEFEGSEEGKQKILQMRNKLAEMGKEELFFRWVQLVQEEAGKPGGFSKERQMEAGLKVQALFEEEGVDWEKFSKEVGLERAG
jgi:hypothetical protein